MSVTALNRSLNWGEVACSAAFTGVAATLLTSVTMVPAMIFGGTKAVLEFMSQEGFKNLFGTGVELGGIGKCFKDVFCFVIPTAGAVIMTSLLGFPMTFGTGCLLVVAAVVAQIGLLCLCAGGGCCVVALASSV